ncbi:MAG: hypothetical protein ACT4N2_15725 [Hyphomicrobium sp.]
MAADDVDAKGEPGSCCAELKEAMSGDEFEPLITVADNGVLYMSVGLIEMEDDEPGMVDHPLFFCPFCGSKVQTVEDVRAKSGEE